LQRHPDRVIWELDDWIFCDAADIDANPYLPADLYRRNAKGIAAICSTARRRASRPGSWRDPSRRFRTSRPG